MKRAPQAPSAAPILYKALTADGHSPYITTYAWSLPVCGDDGVWTPGAWHAEPADLLSVGFKGLHLTPEPSAHGYGCAAGLVCAVEYEGVVGDPETDSQVVAARVRLTRVVPAAEWQGEERRWQSERHVRARRAEVKERLDVAREAATTATRNLAAERAAGIDSPGLLAFRMLIELTPADSWVDVNGSRRDALEYVVRRLRMNPDDVGTISKDYRGSYWLNAEGLYGEAIRAGNNSACVSLEKFLGRKPWWKPNHKGGRERLHVGSTVRVNDAWHTITSFRDDYLNAKREEGAKVYRITRDMLAGKAAAEAAS